jgi:hypothetical protein
MANAPSPPWTYYCPNGCGFHIIVNARGAHGNDPGSGVEAALAMREHVSIAHPASSEEGDEA